MEKDNVLYLLLTVVQSSFSFHATKVSTNKYDSPAFTFKIQRTTRAPSHLQSHRF